MTPPSRSTDYQRETAGFGSPRFRQAAGKTTMTDGELVREALDGRAAACDELVRRWAPRVLAFCHARMACAHTAEDLAQESLLRALGALSSLESPEKFGAWLFGIARRVCLDWRKSRQNSQVPFTVLSRDGRPREFRSNNGDPEAQVDRADELDRLLAEVESLPPEYREVLMLYYCDDVTYRDLAGMLGVSTATINARLTHARALLRERLAPCRR